MGRGAYEFAREEYDLIKSGETETVKFFELSPLDEEVEEPRDESIEDHYEDVKDFKPKVAILAQATAHDEDIDLDYSQSHLEDFLRTHSQKNSVHV